MTGSKGERGESGERGSDGSPGPVGAPGPAVSNSVKPAYLQHYKYFPYKTPI